MVHNGICYTLHPSTLISKVINKCKFAGFSTHQWPLCHYLIPQPSCSSAQEQVCTITSGEGKAYILDLYGKRKSVDHRKTFFEWLAATRLALQCISRLAAQDLPDGMVLIPKLQPRHLWKHSMTKTARKKHSFTHHPLDYICTLKITELWSKDIYRNNAAVD